MPVRGSRSRSASSGQLIGGPEQAHQKPKEQRISIDHQQELGSIRIGPRFCVDASQTGRRTGNSAVETEDMVMMDGKHSSHTSAVRETARRSAIYGLGLRYRCFPPMPYSTREMSSSGPLAGSPPANPNRSENEPTQAAPDCLVC
jgi:hypothetical protein